MPQSKATQEFVPIKEIQEGVVVMKDGSLRMVLMTSSLNFALKSEDLQESIIIQFQNFLNSLDFSIEIFIESRRMDIKPYMMQLEERHRAQTNELLKVQTREYINFVREFTENSNIMTKRFFVVVPYATSLMSGSPRESIKNKIVGALPLPKKDNGNSQEKQESFLDNKIQLEQRVSVVEQGLLRCGLKTARLGTEELVEFYYKLFNPGELAKAAKII